MQELNSESLLFVFVRNCVESTLERSTIAREHMGLLLHQLVSAGTVNPDQYYKGSVWLSWFMVTLKVNLWLCHFVNRQTQAPLRGLTDTSSTF